MYTNRNKTTKITGALVKLPYFTAEGLSSLLKNNGAHARTFIYRNRKLGKIKRIKREIYVSTVFWERNRNNIDYIYAISSVINPLSYISCETVLRDYGVMTEAIYNVFCVSLKKTSSVVSDIENYSYKNIKKDLFVGYNLRDFMGIKYGYASLAKALFDYLYLKKIWLSPKDDLAESLRLNLFVLTKDDIKEFIRYVDISGSVKLRKVLSNFKKHVWIK